MPTLYNQAIAHRFGIELRETLESEEWHRFDFAVAWVRRTGIRHLEPALRAFLRGGGVIRGIVGIDLENTSYEGLHDLFAICGDGDAEVVVYHNEADVTFHPKLYLFTNDEAARLIVGSNNLTEAGLFTNTEVGLQVDAPVGDDVIVDAQAALQSWSDVRSKLSRSLNVQLLDDLLSEGYVLTEERIRARRNESRQIASPSGRRRRRLFGSRRVSAPTPPAGHTSGGTVGGGRRHRRRVPGDRQANTTGNVILMRVRRASETARRTQIQLPVRKMERFFGSDFFAGVTGLTSSHDGQAHLIHVALAGGKPNTRKLEVPEIDTMDDPVLRLERTPNGISYEAYDRSSAQGRQIMKALEEGMQTDPPTTLLTVADAAHATMARFV